MSQSEPTLSDILKVCQSTNATVSAMDTRITSVETRLQGMDTLRNEMDYVLTQLQRFGVSAPSHRNDDMDVSTPSAVPTPCLSRRSSRDEGSRPAKSARIAEATPSRRTS
eukprot:6150636-Amphidinium_carterae.1